MPGDKRSFEDRLPHVLAVEGMLSLGTREAFLQIRAALPDVRVLFASGYGAEELTARFLSDTDAPLLRKPFDPETLLRTVRAVLDAPVRHSGH